MSDPLSWHVWPPYNHGLPERVFDRHPSPERTDVPELSKHPFHWSTFSGDRAVCDNIDFIFAYVPATHSVQLLSLGSKRVIGCPCPDTWEEALAWLRMTCELVQT